MGGFMLKVKTKQGHHVVNNLSADETIGNLKSKISELTSIPAEGLSVKIGFPPKPLDLSANECLLSASGIINGDTLIVEEKPIPDVVPQQQQRNNLQLDDIPSTNQEVTLPTEGILLKQVVPSDNSCLFTSIGYVMKGQIDTEIGSYLREVISQHVSNDKETFNEAMLGKTNAEYCDWIKKPASWGGAIEVSILSNYYGVEIDVVDITNALINRFGEDKAYGMRVFLLFDGIHYDPLYLESISGGPPKTMFPIEDESVYRQAEQLAKEAQSSRQFTDVDKFDLKCIQCDMLLKGQVQAQQHAKTTGHTNFGEV
ncbi:ubiquitin thioesterase OTU1 [Contarinia nasturtii]|uniref:ubiquitin thioesterase OTU1 n=1 Tax=Contarinia nasturtii TaxID=265458 RepID=UPI0012D4AAEE|nr:ubiquitin thioesterase OTU1 [Contarinia nasturtii]XP_031617852.1 ubiquitin thioesterase OTU1 [Contarinia nasturtii]